MRGDGREATPGEGSRTRSEASHNRLSRRLSRIPPQTEALRHALQPFGGEDAFDLDRWTEAFESSDPDEINLVGAVVNDYNSVVNNVVELVRSGVKAAGLTPAGGPWKENSFRAHIETVFADGGISETQRSRWITLNQMRNRLQHDSPNVGADEAHAEVEELLRGIRGIVESHLAWLHKHGVEL